MLFDVRPLFGILGYCNRRTLRMNNTKLETPPTQNIPTQQVTQSSETWCYIILLSKICKSGIYNPKFKK